jgi:hypothetical protein
VLRHLVSAHGIDKARLEERPELPPPGFAFARPTHTQLPPQTSLALNMSLLLGVQYLVYLHLGPSDALQRVLPSAQSFCNASSTRSATSIAPDHGQADPFPSVLYISEHDVSCGVELDQLQ